MYDSNSALSETVPSSDEPDSQMGGVKQLSGEQKHSQSKISRSASEVGSSIGGASSQFRASLQERLSKAGGARSLALPFGASTRRSRLQKQQEACEPLGNDLQSLSAEASEKNTLTPAMRKKYLKDLFLEYKSHSGLTNILSFKSLSASSREFEDSVAYDTITGGALWALDPVEHAWMMSVVDGNYDTIVVFLSEDPTLLTRKDYVSGYTALHWLAKNGKHETLIKLLKHAENERIPVNVNIKGSGGHTPLHVAAMHNQYMVVKILVGAFSANVDAMDYNGKRAWQYLKGSAPEEMKELLGAWDDEHTYCRLNVNNNCAHSEPPIVEQCQKKTDEVDSLRGQTGRWRFGSFKKLLSPFFSGGKN